MLNSTTVLSHALSGNLEELIKIARQDIALESAKATGGTSMAARQKKALAYINDMQKINPGLAGTFPQEYSGNTYQCFTNGHTAFMLSQTLPGLPESSKPMDLVRCLPIDGDQVEDFPAQLAEARRIIAEHKASTTTAECGYKKTPPIVIGQCGYNPQYLIDVAAILGGTITMYQDDNKPINAARLESENGIAILLPIRLQK